MDYEILQGIIHGIINDAQNMEVKMNWFAFVLQALAAAEIIAKPYIKSDEAKSTFGTVIGLFNAVATGLANQNPDGTPATQAYVPPK